MTAWFRGPRRLRIHRLVDVVAAGVGVVALAPIVGVAALWVRLTSAGGAFFRQQRVGRDNEAFEVIKLRTMRTTGTDHHEWTTVTVDGDERLTAAGRILRRYKIDELPQLINVVRGDMGLVGPRPDVAGFADTLTGADAIVSTVRPGITGPATLLFRNEQSMLASVDNAEVFNRDVLYRAKTAVNVAWIENGTLWDDLRILTWTVLPAGGDDLLAIVSSWSDGAARAVDAVHAEVGDADLR